MRAVWMCLLLVLVTPLTAIAQGSFELTPIFGYRWGGELQAGSSDLLDVDVDVNSAASYGLVLGIPLSRHVLIELMADHQPTDLGERNLFAPDLDSADLDVTYYHVGFVYQWTPSKLRPFVTGSLGVGRLDLDLPEASSEERFSASLGGGLKVQASEHVGFRLEARGFYTDTADWDWDCDDWHGDCWGSGMDLFQHELRVGVVFTF
jgi:hypothetical protein